LPAPYNDHVSEPGASEPTVRGEPGASEPTVRGEPGASEPTVRGEPAAKAGRPVGEQCDVCGKEVPAGEAVKSELSVMNAMCPTAMTFHRTCFESAAALWQPDPDSYCTVDPLFPETGRWVLPEDARRGPA